MPGGVAASGSRGALQGAGCEDSDAPALPGSYAGFASGLLRRVCQCLGGFATYVRDALSRGLPRSRPRELFPLPVHSARRGPAPPAGRSRVRWTQRAAADDLATLALLALSYEAGGRGLARSPASATVGAAGGAGASARGVRDSPAQASVREHARAASSSMLRAATGPLLSLARGRGKITRVWETMAGLAELTQALENARSHYGHAEPCAAQGVARGRDPPEVLWTERTALPERGAFIDPRPFLSDDERRYYDDPGLLESAELPPFEGRPCRRLPAGELPRFCAKLDSAGMLVLVREGDAADIGGMFGVRKEWSAELGAWKLRAVLDRRPRNARERWLPVDMASFPHGVLFGDLMLDPHEEYRVCVSDLPSFYHTLAVPHARAKTNTFAAAVPESAFEGTAALAQLHAREAAGGSRASGRVVPAVGSLAMGDRNAVPLAQSAHVGLLRRYGGMDPGRTLGYRARVPDSDVVEGVMIDDRVVGARVPRRRWKRSPAARLAARLLKGDARAYASVGTADVAAKRQRFALTAVAWGAEVRGAAGKVGAPRARRAALAALSVHLAHLGIAPPSLVGRVLGLWTDVMLYRREVFTVVDALYDFAALEDADHARTLPGPVRTELLMLAALAPLMEVSIRAQVHGELYASDASPYGTGAVAVAVPPAAARALWRQRHRPRLPVQDFSELLEGQASRELFRTKFPPARAPHINTGELRARRTLWRLRARQVALHGTRQLVAYDSRCALYVAAKGRSARIARGLRRELRLTYPYIVGTDCAEGLLWTDSARNIADGPSRGSAAPPAGARHVWVDELWAGDETALAARLATAAAADASAPAVREPDCAELFPWRAVFGAVPPDGALGLCEDETP